MVWKSLKVWMLLLAAIMFSGAGSQRAVAQTTAPQPVPGKSSVPPEFLARPPSITRKIMDQQDIGGYTATVAIVDMPAGGREGRHRHPGILIGLVEQGVLSMDHEPTGVREYKAGETFYIPDGQIHEGFNKGTIATRVVGTFVTRKGEPLTIQTPLP